MASGVEIIAFERQRQIDQEGWTAEHDDDHDLGELGSAAKCYLRAGVDPSFIEDYPVGSPPGTWPWDWSWWKPSTDPIRNLARAGALIAAEIDRRVRAES